MLGNVQWFNLWEQQLFCILDTLCGFERIGVVQIASGSKTLSQMAERSRERNLGSGHRAELAIIVALAPFWQADLRHSWLPTITKFDASVDFGSGVSAADCTPALARCIRRLSESCGDFVRLHGEVTSTTGQKCQNSDVHTALGCKSLPSRLSCPHDLRTRPTQGRSKLSVYARWHDGYFVQTIFKCIASLHS